MGVDDTNRPVAQLHFATMNINGFAKYGWGDRKKTCAEVFRMMPAQLFGVQEFLKYNKKTFQAARPEIRWKLSDRMGDVHNAIGYDEERFKLLEHGTIPLSASGKMEKSWGGSIRSMLYCKFRDKVFRTELLFVNFHLDHKSKRARAKGMDIILEFLAGHSDIPTMLTADMNISPDSPFARWHEPDMSGPYDKLIAAGYKDCWREGNPTNAIRPNTYQAFHGSRYVAPDKFGTWDTDLNAVSHHFKVIDCTVIDCSISNHSASDHNFMDSLVRLKQV